MQVIRKISSHVFFFFFFYKKTLNLKKHLQAKINQQNKIKPTLNNKGNIFSRAQELLKGLKSFVLHFGAFLRSKYFGKKK